MAEKADYVRCEICDEEISSGLCDFDKNIVDCPNCGVRLRLEFVTYNRGKEVYSTRVLNKINPRRINLDIK